MRVEVRAAGRRKPLVPEWSVPVPVDPEGGGDGGLTLRQLIGSIVRSEVAAFRARREERRFVRVLSSREIESGRERGKIDPGGRDPGPSVDPDAAVGAALQAFEDGLYLVILDGEEQRDLDRQVWVDEESRVVFLRLTFLAGA